MVFLLADLITDSALRTPNAVALQARKISYRYCDLDAAVSACAQGLHAIDVERHARVAVYLPKQIETVVALFAATRAGAVGVPINPILKTAQVQHIMHDCDVQILITSAERLTTLTNVLTNCHELRHVIVVDEPQAPTTPLKSGAAVHTWSELTTTAVRRKYHRVIDQDMAMILYTSGSTGKPKGVVLSHCNLVIGAYSVSQYLDNRPSDRLLAALPLSFDYGLSQLTTAFSVGASVTLLDHLFARDVIAAVANESITGLAAVPPLWSQLAETPWPEAAVKSLRYITNSGGAMPRKVLEKLRTTLPNTQVFLMYGLTEAFRATYLAPEEIDNRPDSIGKAIPNAEVLVLRPDGSHCQPNEPGELVQRGALVTLGYWNAPELTAQRFRPAPQRMQELVTSELAVWSGDTVRYDDDGFLYFVGRRDELIKTSGYRVSPTEIEEVISASGLTIETVVFGIPHPTLGQAIIGVLIARDELKDTSAVLEFCRQQLPAYMVPAHLEWRDRLPRNANGKYDRSLLAQEFQMLFTAS